MESFRAGSLRKAVAELENSFAGLTKAEARSRLGQVGVSKDFYFLAEAETGKLRELYVVGTTHPSKFLESKRALSQILKGNGKLGKSFPGRHGVGMKTVSDYYLPRRPLVTIRDLGEIIPALKQ